MRWNDELICEDWYELTVEYWPIRSTIGFASISELVSGEEWNPVFMEMSS